MLSSARSRFPALFPSSHATPTSYRLGFCFLTRKIGSEGFYRRDKQALRLVKGVTFSVSCGHPITAQVGGVRATLNNVRRRNVWRNSRESVFSSTHGVGRRGDSTRRASAAKLGSARTYALVGGATRTRAMHCGFSVATGMETRLVLRRIERALGFQWHEFMVASNENTLSKEQRFLGTSRVSM